MDTKTILCPGGCGCSVPQSAVDAVLAARTASLTDPELAEAQRLYEQTTQGEWRDEVDFVVSQDRQQPVLQTFSKREEDFVNALANRQWIAAAHNLWPKLVACTQGVEAVWYEALERLINEHLNDLRNAADRLRLSDVELFHDQARAMLAKAEEWDAALESARSAVREREGVKDDG